MAKNKYSPPKDVYKFDDDFFETKNKKKSKMRRTVSKYDKQNTHQTQRDTSDDDEEYYDETY